MNKQTEMNKENNELLEQAAENYASKTYDKNNLHEATAWLNTKIDFLEGYHFASQFKEQQVGAVWVKDGWISVNDKLPDNFNSLSNDVVLFWSKKHGFPNGW